MTAGLNDQHFRSPESFILGAASDTSVPLDLLDIPKHNVDPAFRSNRKRYSGCILPVADELGILKNLSTPLSLQDLDRKIGIGDRLLRAVMTLLISDGFVKVTPDDRFKIAKRYRDALNPDGKRSVQHYFGLDRDTDFEKEVLSLLRRGDGRTIEGGSQFVAEDGKTSAMDDPAIAKFLNDAMEARSRYTAPLFARHVRLPRGTEYVYEIGSGGAHHLLALLQSHTELKGVALDREPLMKFAAENACRCGVADRLFLVPGNMFDPIPLLDGKPPGAVILSNVIHDWGKEAASALISNIASSLVAENEIWVHDVAFRGSNLRQKQNRRLAQYGMDLALRTPGQVYYQKEYVEMMNAADMYYDGPSFPTAADCRLFRFIKS